MYQKLADYFPKNMRSKTIHCIKLLVDKTGYCLEIEAFFVCCCRSDFAKKAIKNNFAVIVAGAGGSAHLPGMIASITTLPVIGVPVETKKLKGLDSLLSTVQMPKGIPVGTVAIGENGAFNAGLLAASIIGLFDHKVKKNLEKWRRLQTASVKRKPK